jgi:hypothetical protein
MSRRIRQARAIRESDTTFQIQFIPGGFYHVSTSHDWLYSGVRRLATTEAMMHKLWPLASKAMASPGEWVKL